MEGVMRRILLKSKIHNAMITHSNLYYAGSITIDENLMERADIVENERVQVVNLNNGARFETYAICGKRGSGMICLNGPAARLGVETDIIHILTYATVGEEELKTFKPVKIVLNEKNEIIDEKKISRKVIDV